MQLNSLPIYSLEGSKAGDLELQDDWIELEKGDQAVKDAVTAFLANQRAGTASTKTRAEVRGGGTKPWRQKGIGRARAGSIRSPIWTGGGIIFGPKPRSYRKKVNEKVKRLALQRALSESLNDGRVTLIDSLRLGEPKTRLMVKSLENLGVAENTLIVCDKDDISDNVKLATRNIESVMLLPAHKVNAYWLLAYQNVVFEQRAFEEVISRFQKTHKSQET